MITDRTFCELDVSSERRLFGKYTRALYKFVSCNWKVSNDANFIQAKACLKIVTCDPMDDVVDNFSVLSTGVACKLAQRGYKEARWAKLYEAMCLIYKMESRFYEALREHEKDDSFRLVKINSLGSLDQETSFNLRR